jgi:hypothetical protein
MMRDLIIALGLAPSGPGVRGAVDTTGGAGGVVCRIAGA